MLTVKPESEWKAWETGLFHLPESKYRPAPGVNQTALKAMLRSPAHCRAALDELREVTEAMLIGTLAHLACLEPDSYGDGVSHFVKPANMSFATKEGKEWRSAHNSLPIITAADAANLDGMRDAVRSHEVAGRMIESGVCEVAAFTTCPKTGLPLKAKLDKLFVDGSGLVWIADLKKVQDARDFQRQAVTFRYDLQSAFYRDVATACGLDIAGFLFLVVEEEKPHGILTYRACAEFMENGRRLYEGALEQYATCQMTGHWPGYSETVELLELPAWAK